LINHPSWISSKINPSTRETCELHTSSRFFN